MESRCAQMRNRDMDGTSLINTLSHTFKYTHVQKLPYELKMFFTHTHTHTLPRLCVIFEVSQPSAKSGLFISPGASEREL